MWNQDRLLALIDAIYRAALDDRLANRLADTLAQAFDSPSCLVYFARRKADAPTAMPDTSAILSGTHEFDVRTCTAYAEYYHGRNEWYSRAWAMPAPYVVLGEELIPTRDLLRTEWSDFLHMTHTLFVLGTQFDVSSDLIGIIGLHRAPTEKPFDESDRRRMKMLVPHLQLSLQMRERVALAERRAGFAVEALGDLAVGVVVTLSDATVLYANSIAETVLSAAHGLTVRDGCLQPSSMRQVDEFRRLIHAVSAATAVPTARTGGAMTLVCRSGEVLPILVAPLPAESVRYGSNAPAAAVFFSDPCGIPEVYPDAVARRFGLTPSESRLLKALMQGKELADYARDANIGIGTARTHLKQIFQKTGQHRQADVVRLALGDPMTRLWRPRGSSQ